MRQATRSELIDELAVARESTLTLLERLSQDQWNVPYSKVINPPSWEMGHVGWFQEYWCLRYRKDRAPRGSILAASDRWFDSTHVEHTSRWALDLPETAELREFLSDTLDNTLNKLEHEPDTADSLYFYKLALFHEQMHNEAFCMTWQHLNYQPPIDLPSLKPFKRIGKDIAFNAGAVILGSEPDTGFVFDNEKWSLPVDIAPFEIGAQPVTNAEFLSFVNDDGYLRPEFWDKDYFAQLQAMKRRMPIHWRASDRRVQEHAFGRWEPIDVFNPAMHISAFEAQAYCTWAGKRLPTEAEWQYAATHSNEFEWGSHVWEWTSSVFNPFPGFVADPYKEYSAPWFGNHRVVKGASFITARALVDARFRNFYLPHRDDPFVGFRVCSV